MMELGIVEEHGFHQGRVKKRAVDAEGKPIGIPNDNVLLDGCAHEIEFADGQTEILAANVVAGNLLAGMDAEGNRFVFMDEIEKTADAIP